VSTIGKGAPVALSGAAGYRFNRVFGLGAEVTVVPSLTPGTPRSTALPAADFLTVPLKFDEEGGHAVVFTTNVRLELPVGSARILPYIVGGGGVGQVRERVRTVVSFSPSPSPPGIVVPLVLPAPTTVVLKSDSTDLALTIGGGVSFPIIKLMSIDAEARYLSLLGRRDFNVGRFGGGVTFRF
jgi:opacity protein-like surface antigen